MSINKARLWILRPIHIENDDPWEPWYDKVFGFIIQAETEQRAREIAAKDAGDEKYGEKYGTYLKDDIKNPWLDSKYSSCKELVPYGSEELIMKDFHAA